MENNELAVFAPVALTRNVRDLIDKDMDAKVKYIIAPDAEHHIFLSDWQKEYPEAKVIVPEPLVEKRRKAGQLLPEQGDPRLVAIKEGASYSVDPTFDQQFNLEYVHAHANKELVFNHKASRTLIEADLMFNLPAREQTSMLGRSQPSGILSRIFGGMNSTQGEALSQRRFIWYLISAGNRSAFNSSVSRIDGWDFDRIVPCHGDVIETGGKGIFQKVPHPMSIFTLILPCLTFSIGLSVASSGTRQVELRTPRLSICIEMLTNETRSLCIDTFTFCSEHSINDRVPRSQNAICRVANCDADIGRRSVHVVAQRRALNFIAIVYCLNCSKYCSEIVPINPKCRLESRPRLSELRPSN